MEVFRIEYSDRLIAVDRQWDSTKRQAYSQRGKFRSVEYHDGKMEYTMPSFQTKELVDLP